MAMSFNVESDVGNLLPVTLVLLPKVTPPSVLPAKMTSQCGTEAEGSLNSHCMATLLPDMSIRGLFESLAELLS